MHIIFIFIIYKIQIYCHTRESLMSLEIADELIDYFINVAFGSDGHVALDRNLEPEYNTLLLRLIPVERISACPRRQIRILPGLLDSRAALSNSYPNASRAMQRDSVYQFYDGLWYDPTGTRTHDLPWERRIR